MSRRAHKHTLPGKTVRRPGWTAAVPWVCAGLLALAALLCFTSRQTQIGELANRPWTPTAAETIVRNRQTALWHAAGMMSLAALFFTVFRSGRRLSGRVRCLAAWALVLLVAGDAVWLARHYVHALPRSLVQENDVIRLLKQELGAQRVAMVTQQGFYNEWLTYLFPRYGIPALNVAQMPRMLPEYQAFLQTVGGRLDRFWQLGAVKYVLMPASFIPSAEQDPAFHEIFEVRYAFHAIPLEEGGTRIEPGSRERPGHHALLLFKLPAPRLKLVGAWEAHPDDETLRRLADPAWPLFERLLLPPAAVQGLRPLTQGGYAGEVRIIEKRPGYFRVRVRADRPALLRVSEKYDPAWRARVAARPAPVLRCDYLFMAVPLESGVQEVELIYRPRPRSLLLLLVALGVFAAGAARALRGSASDRQSGGTVS